jgi:ElaB/YqjD/DUF883 family membrane-anchored ribosome-binding protein
MCDEWRGFSAREREAEAAQDAAVARLEVSLEDRVDRVDAVLGAVFRRNGHEAIEARTAVDDLLARETAELQEEPGRVAEVRSETVARMLEFFFAGGPHPSAVMRRVYAWAKKFRPDLILNMSLRDMGILFDESHEAVRSRIELLFDKAEAARGAKAVRAPWQRGEKTRERCRKAQRGNRNRVGGRKRV